MWWNICHQITKILLRKHFAEFGPIDHFTLHLKLSYCYGFIQYKSVYSAATALRNQHHYVAGFKIKVSVADSWHQPLTTEKNGLRRNSAHGSNEASENSEQLNIHDLNDDCLLHVFGYMNCIDLSSIDQTCVRFQRLAGEVFRKNHLSIDLERVSSLTLLQIRSLFVSYGSQIQKLQVAAVSFKQENRYRVLDLIIRSCTTLKTLCLTGFYIKVMTKTNNETTQ